jgi:hypothetical protein
VQANWRIRHAGLVALISFGGGRQLSIKVREPNALMRGAGMHRLTFPVELDARNTISGGVPITLSGHAWLSMSSTDWLGTWTTERVVVSQEGLTFDAVIVLTLNDEQLAVIEQRRAGGDLRLMLDVNVVLGYDPAASSGDQNTRWPASSFQENLYIYGDAWRRLLHQTALATSLAVVVPVPLDGGAAAKVGTHLREAIRKVNDGEYGDAVLAARRAIDSMGTDWIAEKAAVQTQKDQRSLHDRLSALRHALHALASPSAHGDEVADSIRWDREKALAVIAGVSALAACKSA